MYILFLLSGGTIAETFETALNTIKTDVGSAVMTIAPIAIGIAGIFLVWKYGLRFFKSVSK